MRVASFPPAEVRLGSSAYTSDFVYYQSLRSDSTSTSTQPVVSSLGFSVGCLQLVPRAAVGSTWTRALSEDWRLDVDWALRAIREELLGCDDVLFGFASHSLPIVGVRFYTFPDPRPPFVTAWDEARQEAAIVHLSHRSSHVSIRAECIRLFSANVSDAELRAWARPIRVLSTPRRALVDKVSY